MFGANGFAVDGIVDTRVAARYAQLLGAQLLGDDLLPQLDAELGRLNLAASAKGSNTDTLVAQPPLEHLQRGPGCAA